MRRHGEGGSFKIDERKDGGAGRGKGTGGIDWGGGMQAAGATEFDV